MKKIKYLLMVALLFVTVGCVKFNANMEIKKDKSMDFSIIYALDKTYFNGENALKESDYKEMEKEGFTVSKYTDGNFEGFKMLKKVNNIDEVSSESDTEFNLSGMMSNTSGNNNIFKVVKGEKSNTYYAKFKFDSNDSGLNMEDDEETSMTDFDTELPDEANDITDSKEDIDLSGMMQGLDLSFSVTLPTSAISSNATTKENNDKKLTWKLTTSGSEYIEFAFEMPNNAGSGFNMNILYIVGGVLAVIILVVVILIVTKNNKKKPVVNNNQVNVSNNDTNDAVTPISKTLDSDPVSMNQSDN